MTLKGYVNMEAQMTYVERVFQYIDLPGEPAAALPLDPAGAWPSAGRMSHGRYWTSFKRTTLYFVRRITNGI